MFMLLVKVNLNIVVFDGSTFYGGALWLSYRRNLDEFKCVIEDM